MVLILILEFVCYFYFFLCVFILFFFFFKQKTAYEMRISDWSSDVCSSDLRVRPLEHHTDALAVRHEVNLAPVHRTVIHAQVPARAHADEIGRASCRERVCQYV